MGQLRVKRKRKKEEEKAVVQVSYFPGFGNSFPKSKMMVTLLTPLL